MRNPRFIRLLAILAMGAGNGTLSAQDYTWTGAFGSAWNTGLNWGSATFPDSPTAHAMFTGAGLGAVNIGAGVQTQMISFSNPSGSYTLTSSANQVLSGLTTINVGSGVTGVQTINLANVATGSLFFTGSGPGALTINNNANPFIGDGALTIGPTTVIGTSGTGGITITGDGPTTISGTFSGNLSTRVNGGLVHSGPGPLTLSGNSSSLFGGITLDGGSMNWDYSATTASKLGGGNLLLRGGSLNLRANALTAVTQNVPGGTTTIDTRGSTVFVENGLGALANITFNAGALSRVATGTLSIYTLDPGTSMTTTTALTNGILGPWAIINNEHWASKSGSTIVGLSAYGTNVYAPSTNTDVTVGSGIPSGFTTSTLRFGAPLTATLSGVNTIQTGGILTAYTNNAGAMMTGGTLVSGTGGFIIQNSGKLTIDSAMAVSTGMTVADYANGVFLGGPINWMSGAPLTLNRGRVYFTNSQAFSNLTEFHFNSSFGNHGVYFQLPAGQNATCAAAFRLAGNVAPSQLNLSYFVNDTPDSRITLSGVLGAATGYASPAFYGITETSGFNLTGTNTFAGDIRISGGVLGFQTDANFGAAGNNLILAPSLTSNRSGIEFLTDGTALQRTVQLEGASRFIVAANNTNSIAGVVSGAGSLSKIGTGTLVLGNPANGYSGGTYVQQGRLTLGHGDAIPANTYVEVQSGAEFNTGGFSNTAGNQPDFNLDRGTFRAPANGEYHMRALSMNGGAVDPTGASDFALRFGSGAYVFAYNTASGPSQWLGSGGSRILNDSGGELPIYAFSYYFGVPSPIALDVGAAMQGSGPSMRFFVGGSGTVRLTNLTNTADFRVYATLRADDITSGGVGGLGSGAIELIGGTLAYGGSSATLSKPISVTGFGGFQILNDGVNLTIPGVINPTGAVDVVGFVGPAWNNGPERATFVLTANNSYGGATFVYSGAIVAMDALPDTGQASPIGPGFGGIGSLCLGASTSGRGELKTTGTNAAYTTNRDITVGGLWGFGAGGAINVANAGTNLTLVGQIFNDVNSGPSAFIKTGPGTLTLANSANSYTGGTYLESGRLALGVGTAIPAGTNVTVFPGAEFNTNGLSNDPTTAIGAVTLNGGAIRVPSGSPYYYLNKLIVNGAGAAIDLTGTTGITGLSLAGVGASISVNVNCTWTGPISSFVANGSNAELPITIAPAVTLTSDLSLAVNGTLPPNSTRLTGGGTLYLRNPPQYVADLTVNQARLRLDDFNNVGPLLILTLDNGTLAYGGPTQSFPAAFNTTLNGAAIEVVNAATTLTLTGAIGNGGGPLTKTGSGTLVLSNTGNVYSGGIVVDAGRLDVAADIQLGQAAITVNPAGTVRFTNSTSTSRNFTLFNGTMDVSSGATLTMNGANVFGGFLRGSGTYALNGGAALFGVTTFPSTVVNVTGPASVGNFAHNGNLTVATGQSLAMSYATNASAGRMTVNGAAIVSDLVSNGQIQVPNGGLINNTGSPSGIVLGGGSTTFVGTQANPGGVINVGTQPMLVRGGLLVNNGAIGNNSGNGQVIVDYGGFAKGAGYYDTIPQTINGGRFSPGNSPGRVTVGSVNMNPGGIYDFEINNATGIAGPTGTTNLSGWDLTIVSNAINPANSNLTVTATPAQPFTINIVTLRNPSPPDIPDAMANFSSGTVPFSWLAFDVNPAGTVTNWDPSAIVINTSQVMNMFTGTFGIVRDGGNPFQFYITYTPVPEPQVVLGIAFAGLCGWTSWPRLSRNRRGFGTITAWPK